MKKDYIKPIIEIEEFELNAAIAAQCDYKVNLGPGDQTNETCSVFQGFEKLGEGVRAVSEGPFYDGSCSCYLSSGGVALLTS